MNANCCIVLTSRTQKQAIASHAPPAAARHPFLLASNYLCLSPTKSKRFTHAPGPDCTKSKTAAPTFGQNKRPLTSDSHLLLCFPISRRGEGNTDNA